MIAVTVLLPACRVQRSSWRSLLERRKLSCQASGSSPASYTGGNGKSVVKVVRARDAAKSCCKQLEELAIEQGLFRKLHARGKSGSYTPSQHANDNE
jgi:hypothetical protein